MIAGDKNTNYLRSTYLIRKRDITFSVYKIVSKVFHKVLFFNFSLKVTVCAIQIKNPKVPSNLAVGMNRVLTVERSQRYLFGNALSWLIRICKL